MKRIIDGVTYNTDTSTMIARSEEADEHWPKAGSCRTLVLYQTRGGAFFIHVNTATLRRNVYTEDWEEIEHNEFAPMTYEQAQKWVMDGQVELISDEAFGEPPEAAAEAAPAATLYIRIPTSLKGQIEAAASVEKLSVNAWAMRCMETCVASQKTIAADGSHNFGLAEMGRALGRSQKPA